MACVRAVTVACVCMRTTLLLCSVYVACALACVSTQHFPIEEDARRDTRKTLFAALLCLSLLLRLRLAAELFAVEWVCV